MHCLPDRLIGSAGGCSSKARSPPYRHQALSTNQTRRLQADNLMPIEAVGLGRHGLAAGRLVKGCHRIRRPPKPHRLEVAVSFAPRLLPRYRRPRLWPRTSVARRQMRPLGLLSMPSGRMRQLGMIQLQKRIALQDGVTAHRSRPNY